MLCRQFIGRPGLLVALLLVGCAQVPTIPEPPAGTSAERQVVVDGARGPLSQRAADAVLRRLAAQAPDAGALERHLAIEQVVAGTPLYTGNRVTILKDGPAALGAIFAAIHGARQYLYLEYYTFEDVENDGEHLSDVLLERASQGVHIALMYDSVGSISTPKDFFDRLAAGGVQVHAFNPLNPLTKHFAINDRDHRKLLLADGRLAIIGGVNLSSDYQSATFSSGENEKNARAREAWHDTDMQIEGPAVSELKALFDAHWRQQSGEEAALAATTEAPASGGDQVVRIIGSQAGGRLSPRYYATLLSSIRSAATNIDVTAAYFAPTHQESEALLHAARRGVLVRLLLPSHSDSSPALAVQHAHYHAMLKAGIQIFERQDGILHSKTVTSDGVWSIVGSSNFDHRSVLFNDEIDAVVIGSLTGSALERYFEQDLQHAQRIDAEDWDKRSVTERVRERFWRLWEALL